MLHGKDYNKFVILDSYNVSFGSIIICLNYKLMTAGITEAYNMCLSLCKMFIYGHLLCIYVYTSIVIYHGLSLASQN